MRKILPITRGRIGSQRPASDVPAAMNSLRQAVGRDGLRRLIAEFRHNSLLRNSLYQMSAVVVTSVLGYAYWVIAARLYSAYDVGLGAALISAVTLASLVSNLGLTSTLIYHLPRRANGHDWSLIVNAALLGGTATGLVAGAIMLVVLPSLSSQYAPIQDDPVFAFVLLVSVPLWTVGLVLDYAFIAERAAGGMLLRNAVFGFSKFPLIIIPVLLASRGSLWIFASWAVASAVSILMGAIVLMRLGRAYVPVVRGALGELRRMLGSMTGNHLTTLGGGIGLFILPTFVIIRLSVADNAYFYTTWMLGSLFFMVSSSVGNSLFAEGSHAAEELTQNVIRSIRIIAVLLAPAMLVYFVGGRYLLGVLGPEYPAHGLGLLLVLTAGAIPDAITNIYVSAERSQGRLKYCAALNICMAFITLALAWVLLPVFGIIGAGLAWLIAQSVGSLFVFIHLGVYEARRRHGSVHASLKRRANAQPTKSA